MLVDIPTIKLVKVYFRNYPLFQPYAEIERSLAVHMCFSQEKLSHFVKFSQFLEKFRADKFSFPLEGIKQDGAAWFHNRVYCCLDDHD